MSQNPITLTLAHSPDPDDAFMWWPLGDASKGIEPRIDTRGFRFAPVAADIEALNRRAIEVGDLDITALSFHAFTHCAERYALTRCGASFGDGYGPKIVSRERMTFEDLRTGNRNPSPVGEDAETGPPHLPRGLGILSLGGERGGRGGRERITIAIPGERTTAYLTMRLMLGDVVPKTIAMPFHRIVEAVKSGEVDAGIVIHEAQLTYADAGLHLVVDLGEWWKEQTGLPIPLGANAIRRDLDARYGAGTSLRVATVLRDSIVFAREHRREGLAVAEGFAQPGTTGAQADTFVAMYVNDLTIDAGPRGQRAVAELVRRGAARGLVPEVADLRMIGPA